MGNMISLTDEITNVITGIDTDNENYETGQEIGEALLRASENPELLKGIVDFLEANPW